jgi:predicted alpha/beta-fold hydrolase
MTSAFTPAWWCRGPHLQTLWPYFMRRGPNPRLRRERLELPDGDFLDLDWNANTSGPIVLILHGLEGSSRSHYARALLAVTHARGWRGALLHFRGCSGEPNRLARGYHSGDTADLAHVVEVLRTRQHSAQIAVVGFSLGGNVLLKWLGESGERAPIDAAVAVSVPFMLGECADRLAQGFSRIYQWELMHRMRRSVAHKRERIAMPLAITDLSRLRTFREFDEHVTAPLHGFRGATHYYDVSSCRQYLSGISHPTLIVHALDDPFMTPATAPTAEEVSRSTTLELYRSGGHVGFVSGRWPWQARYWLDQRIPAFLAPHFGAA